MKTTRDVLDLGPGLRRLYYTTPRGVLAVTQQRRQVRGRALWCYLHSSQVPEVPHAVQ